MQTTGTTEPATTAEIPRQAWRMLAVATAGFAVNFWAWALVSPLGAFFTDELGLSAVEKSLLVAVPVVVGSLGRIPVGALTDRFGARTMFPLVSALTIVPVLFIGYVGSDSYAMMLLGGFVLGLGGTTFAIGVPLVNAWFPPAKRGTALGIFGAGMGGTAISAFTHRVAQGHLRAGVPLHPGRRPPGRLRGVLLPAAAGRPRPARSPPASVLRRTWDTFRLPVTLQMSFLYAVGFGGFVAFSVYLPTYLRDAFGLTPGDAALRTAGFVVLAVIMRPVGGSCPTGCTRSRCSSCASPSSPCSRRCRRWSGRWSGSAPSPSSAMAAALGAASGAVFALVAIGGTRRARSAA